MFILVEMSEMGIGYTSIYAGGTYIHQGEIFPCVVSALDDYRIKKYSTIGRAKNASEKLEKKTGRKFEVKSI